VIELGHLVQFSTEVKERVELKFYCFVGITALIPFVSKNLQKQFVAIYHVQDSCVGKCYAYCR
jgi:hypothetical protein